MLKNSRYGRSTTGGRTELHHVFGGLAAIPLDRTFYALHMITTYQENVEDFPMEFPNVNLTADAIILDKSFNDNFSNPINDDAFQNP